MTNPTKDKWKSDYLRQYNPDKKYAERHVAKMIGCSYYSIKKAREIGATPPYTESSGRVYYSQKNIHKWLQELHSSSVLPTAKNLINHD